MAAYCDFTSARATRPDPIMLLSAVRVATGDPTAVLCDPFNEGRWRGKKTSAWSGADISATQAALDAAPAITPQTTAQRNVDGWPIETRALVLALLDQINVLRTKAGMATVTPAQALQVVRDKAGTL